MDFILDTNICVYIIKKEPSSVLKKFKHLVPGDVGISSVTLAELCFGIEKSLHKEKNRLALESFLLPFEILPFDENAANCYGIIRAQLEKAGKPIGPLDLMIAAHAKSLALRLVTHNVKEFKKVAGLKVEDWV